MTDCEKIVILGASGLIGRYLYHQLKKTRKKVIGTYNQNPTPNLRKFDFLDSDKDCSIFDGAKYAFICSAMTKRDECKDKPQLSREVNVYNTIKVILEIVKRGCTPIFTSSAAVFDCNQGDYEENAVKNPTTEYGKQKLEVERFMISSLEDYLIIRPGKVFGLRSQEGGLFADWLENYRQNKEMLCAYDENLSPTFAGDLARGMEILIERDFRGVYHINYPEHFSRLDLTKKFFRVLGISDAKIRGCSIDDFNFAEKRGKNTHMNVSKFLSETGFKFTELDVCLRKVLDTKDNS